jgi:hypothetical protein
LLRAKRTTGDFVLEQAGGAEFRHHRVAGFALERLGHVGQGAAQAAGGIELDGVGKGGDCHARYDAKSGEREPMT